MPRGPTISIWGLDSAARRSAFCAFAAATQAWAMAAEERRLLSSLVMLLFCQLVRVDHSCAS
jgi:hypothetical protein